MALSGQTVQVPWHSVPLQYGALPHASDLHVDSIRIQKAFPVSEFMTINALIFRMSGMRIIPAAVCVL